MSAKHFVLLAAISGLTLGVAVPSHAAPCKGSRGRVVHRTYASQPAVVHEHVVAASPTKVVAADPAAADVVDTAVGAGTFKTLAAALTAADLVGTLKGSGPFTVFAPTDEAFAKLPAGTVETFSSRRIRTSSRRSFSCTSPPGPCSRRMWSSSRKQIGRAHV